MEITLPMSKYTGKLIKKAAIAVVPIVALYAAAAGIASRLPATELHTNGASGLAYCGDTPQATDMQLFSPIGRLYLAGKQMVTGKSQFPTTYADDKNDGKGGHCDLPGTGAVLSIKQHRLRQFKAGLQT